MTNCEIMYHKATMNFSLQQYLHDQNRKVQSVKEVDVEGTEITLLQQDGMLCFFVHVYYLKAPKLFPSEWPFTTCILIYLL